MLIEGEEGVEGDAPNLGTVMLSIMKSSCALTCLVQVVNSSSLRELEKVQLEPVAYCL